MGYIYVCNNAKWVTCGNAIRENHEVHFLYTIYD
jgi:hypothetical protein